MALLEAGAELLRDCAFDELSIDELCGRVGVTIGAFYGRFESKDAFFSALMSLAVEAQPLRRSTRRSQGQACRCGSGNRVPRHRRGGDRACSAATKAWCARRCNTRRCSRRAGSRSPKPAPASANAAMPLLLARMGRGRQAAKQRAIGFAFQIVSARCSTRCRASPGSSGCTTDELDRPSGAGDIPAARSRGARRGRTCASEASRRASRSCPPGSAGLF